MKTKNLQRQLRLAILRQNAEQEDLLQETTWEKRQRTAAEAEEEYWAAMERQELLEGEEDW